MCEARLFELDNIRKIRALVPGCTVNDVILSIVGGAMREYLDDKGELPMTSLTAMCPISLRGTTAQGGRRTPTAARWRPATRWGP